MLIKHTYLKLILMSISLCVMFANAASSETRRGKAPASIPSRTTSAKPQPAPTEPPSASETLDQKTIHEHYNNGDFEPVISAIEGFKIRNKKWDYLDSIFIAKHLAVVYSANPTTREKGRYYMLRLLELLPSAKLVDMYVSEEVDRIFDKVREEFLVRQKGFGLDSSEIDLPRRPKGDTKEPVRTGEAYDANEPGFNRPRNWVIGGLTLAAAAAGAGAYLYLAESDVEAKAPPKEVIVPNK